MTDTFIGNELARMARLGLVQTRKPFSQLFDVTPVAGATFHQAQMMPGAFSAARAIYLNHSTSLSGVKAAFAPSSVWGNGYEADGTWVDATFGGATTGTIPAGSISGLNATYGVLATDWSELTSLGTQHILMCRTYAAGNLPSLSVDSARVTSYNTIAPGLQFGTWSRQSFDGVADKPGFSSPAPTASSRVCPAILQVRTRKRGLSIMGIGSSNFMGQGTTSDNNSFGFQAVKSLLAEGFPCSWTNEGIAGTTSANWLVRFNGLVDVVLPDVALINTWTTNDGDTAAAAQAGISRTFAIAEACLQKGIVPILVTAPPHIGNTVVTDAHRIWANTQAREATGLLVADIDAVLSDGATPARLVPAYNSGDGTHLNDAGAAAAAAVILPLLRRIAGLRATG